MEEDNGREKDTEAGTSLGTGDIATISERVEAYNPAAILPVHSSMADSPAIGQINAKNSTVHIGTKVVKVTQVIKDGEVVKSRLFGLALETPSQPSRYRCRCSVMVFVCWASFVAFATIIFLFYFFVPKQKRLDIGLKEPWYFQRDEWQAMAAYGFELLDVPVKIAVLGHSATRACHSKSDCMKAVLAIQQDHLRRQFDDIGPNFLVGGDGLTFEGRGANVLGSMVYSWNRKIISIMLIGDYCSDEFDVMQQLHTKILLDTLVEKGALVRDYILYGHCQISTLISSPGPKVMEKMGYFSHWVPANTTMCLPM